MNPEHPDMWSKALSLWNLAANVYMDIPNPIEVLMNENDYRSKWRSNEIPIRCDEEGEYYVYMLDHFPANYGHWYFNQNS